MIFSPEEKTDLVWELKMRAAYYEKQIASCLEWQQYGMTKGQLTVTSRLENARRRLEVVNALIEKANGVMLNDSNVDW